MAHDKQKIRRWTVSGLLLLAAPLYVVCGLSHVCMCGHMEHGPYSFIHMLNDYAWIFAMVISCVFCWKSDMYGRWTVFFICVFLGLSRVLLGSGGSVFFLFEIPLLIWLIVLAIRGFFKGAKDWRQATVEEWRRHYKRTWRIFFVSLGIAIALVLAVWGGYHLWWGIRRALVPRVQVTARPFTGNYMMKPGDAYVFKLPGGKELAVWCVKNKYRGMSGFDEELEIKFGEQSFHEKAYDEASYVHSGSTTQYGSDAFEYHLGVAGNSVDLKEKPMIDGKLPIEVNVR